MSRIFIGVGANTGERRRNIQNAVSRVAALPGLAVRAVSSIYETEPVGGPPQEWYLNCAIEALSDTRPRPLLGQLKDIEKAMGRRESVRHGPRLIDLDILLYGDLVIEGEDLTIPHAELHRRAFALIPLLEIGPDIVHPSLHTPLKQLLADLGASSVVRPFSPPPPLAYNDQGRASIK